MAGTSIWYARAAGNALNAGGGNSDAARVTADSTGGSLVADVLTDAGVDFLASGVLETDAVCMVIGGVNVRREIAAGGIAQHALTLIGGVGNETYTGYRVGGAAALPNQVANSGAGNNVAIAASDIVYVQGGTVATPQNYVGLLVLATAITIRGIADGPWSVDGTGGGAGSDPVTMGAACNIYDCVSVNAVDDGFVRTAGSSTLVRCRSQAAGGDGYNGVSEILLFCSFRASGANATVSGSGLTARFCEFGDSVGNGFTASTGTTVTTCLIYDNGGIGIQMTTGAVRQIWGNTIEGNTGDGIDLTLVTSLSAGSVIMNNIISNNAIGIDSNAGAQTAIDGVLIDYNIFFGNSTARNNIPVGTHDSTSDPGFTAAASDDYSIKSTGSAYKAGYSPFKNPTLNTLNIGAVTGPGSAEQVGDYPIAGNVRTGITYANGTLTGTVVLPAVGDVKAPVQYGAGGTEYTGTYAPASGSGGSAIFPSQMRGGPGR